MPGRLGLSMMAVQSYERLEWLGDAVLELTIRRLLMNKYPGSDEVRAFVCVRGLLCMERSLVSNLCRLPRVATEGAMAAKVS